ncbi:MAG: hypothetical protein KDE47_33380, partial [Caldilineaceae bacterium]|nr:hypothetical protein [Caldilineaceae bacterium]
LGDAYLTLGDWAAAQHAFVQAQQHRSAISDEPHYAARAGQAYAAWQLGDCATALALAATVLDAPWTTVAQQTDTPFYIYWRCYQILAAYADERAPMVLHRIHKHFQDQLTRIEDPTLRRSFAEQVPAHRQLLAAIAQSHATGAASIRQLLN